jgi:hypothetical protein
MPRAESGIVRNPDDFVKCLGNVVESAVKGSKRNGLFRTCPLGVTRFV